MKNISYYIMAAALTVATISVGGCTDDNESVSPLHSGVLSLYDFAPNTGMGGTQILINGEKYPINTEEIDVTINDVELSIVRSNEEQLLVEIPDNEAVDGGPIVIRVGNKTVQSKDIFKFQKCSILNTSTSVVKKGMKVKVFVENMPANITMLEATYNGVKAECVAEEGCFLVTIPNTEPGIYPIVLNFNGRKLTTADIECVERLYERTVTTLLGSDVLKFMCADWDSRRGGIAVDDNGNVFVTDMDHMRIRKITPEGVVSEVAGTGTPDTPDWGINWRNDNNGTGSYNATTRPCDLKIDSKGNMYTCDDWIAGSIRFEPDGKAHYLGWHTGVSLAIDEVNNRFYFMTSNGNIYMKGMDEYGPDPINGGGTLIITGDGNSGGMDVDKRNGDLYITNVGRNQILKYAKDDWNNPIVIAGSGEKGYEDGTCATASFCSPWGIAVAPDGNIYVAGNGATDANAQANNLDQSIRYIDMSTHMVTTFAGCNESGNMDGTFATLTWGGVNYPSEKLTAAFGSATAVCVGNDGTVYVLDRKNNSVKKITTIE